MRAQAEKSVQTSRVIQSRSATSAQASVGEVLQSYKSGIVQRKANRTGLPDNLKTGIESLSGFSMDDVQVHYDSSQPAQLQAHAYTQGTDIHVAPGQEKHLPHEAWHVVQQKQGRVQPTMQMKGIDVNDDSYLEREADHYGILALNNTGTQTTSEPSISGKTSPIVQMFRLVQPEDKDYKRGKKHFFSTHKVVHKNKNKNKRKKVGNETETHINNELLQEMIVAGFSGKSSIEKYFFHLGKTADPQRPGSLLGDEDYKVSGTDPNSLDQNSKFSIKILKSDFHFPMFVSETKEFAINARYSDPKEVYMSPTAAGQANNNLKNCILSPQPNTITIEGTALNKYIPIFSADLVTNACDEFAKNYYNEITENNPLNPQSNTQVLKGSEINRRYLNESLLLNTTPWPLHVAGILCNDGNDKLSLENGARFSWLRNRNGEKSQINPHVEEMNKTWYFRMYGPEVEGQDIKNQTISRFTDTSTNPPQHPLPPLPSSHVQGAQNQAYRRLPPPQGPQYLPPPLPVPPSALSYPLLNSQPPQIPMSQPPIIQSSSTVLTHPQLISALAQSSAIQQQTPVLNPSQFNLGLASPSVPQNLSNVNRTILSNTVEKKIMEGIKKSLKNK